MTKQHYYGCRGMVCVASVSELKIVNIHSHSKVNHILNIIGVRVKKHVHCRHRIMDPKVQDLDYTTTSLLIHIYTPLI